MKLIFLALLAAVLAFWLDSRRLREERVCAAPVRHVAFLTPDECAGVIRAARAHGLRRSQVVGQRRDEISAIRTSYQVFLPHDLPEIEPIVAKAEALLGCSRRDFEEVQVVRYRPGQKYEAHYDSDDDVNSLLLRSDTLLMFLNTVEAGGHTEFPKLGTSVKPRTGMALHWKNIDSHGRILPCAFHGGMPVLRGEKWIATFWRRL